MRDRAKTIESLRRLAERPGNPQEGETARRLLRLLGGVDWTVTSLDSALFPVGARVYYCFWTYRNMPANVMKGRDGMYQTHRGQTWMRLKFDHLKQPRWVPVTSNLGCHIAAVPFSGNEEETLYRGIVDWQERDREFRESCAVLGIDLTPFDELKYPDKSSAEPAGCRLFIPVPGS